MLQKNIYEKCLKYKNVVQFTTVGLLEGWQYNKYNTFSYCIVETLDHFMLAFTKISFEFA